MQTPSSLPSHLQYNPPKPWGSRLSPALTKLSHLPTPFITTFLLVHLSAPALANVGGSSLSSQVMLLGREYYQGTISEPWLLFAPLGIHVVAGVTKRLLSSNPTRRRRPALLTFTAYPLLIFLSIHVLTHRLIPSNPSPPIFSLSPSELNYEFVKAGITGWPLRSSLLYAGLVICGLVHAFEGWGVILRTWCGKNNISGNTKMVLSGIGIGAVLSGLCSVAKEPLLVPQSTLTQINASYLSSVIYRCNWVWHLNS